MNILIGGASGLIGSAVLKALKGEGHEVTFLVRDRKKEGVFWNPEGGILDGEAIEGYDAILNFSGENLASGRWTLSKKRSIRESRVVGTRLISEAIAKVKQSPKVFLNASAIGFYGSKEREVTEESPHGEGFLADVCCDWEEATRPAAQGGARIVTLRIGVVLSQKGGALKKMLFPFKMGFGGVIGSGNQPISWIALDDVVGAVLHCLKSDEIKGPVNLVAPNPKSNRDFTITLGEVLCRPTYVPLPALAVKYLFGEMGEELLLGGTWVKPTVLEKSGYKFKYPELKEALIHR